VELGRLLLFKGIKEAVCCHSPIRLGTAKEAKMQFPKGYGDFLLSALCNSAPKSSETTGKPQKTHPQKLLRTWGMLCIGKTDVREVSHAFLSLLYFENDRLKQNMSLDSVQ
jgi:hypothetical protein